MMLGYRCFILNGGNHSVKAKLLSIVIAGWLGWHANYYWARVTSYCDYGIMADGNYVHRGAAGGSNWIPFGSVVDVPGYGKVTVEDRGPWYAPTNIDLWSPTCSWSWKWGRQYLWVHIDRYGWERNG